MIFPSLSLVLLDLLAIEAHRLFPISAHSRGISIKMSLFPDATPLPHPTIIITAGDTHRSAVPSSAGQSAPIPYYLQKHALFLTVAASSVTAETMSGETFKKILDDPRQRSRYYIIDVRDPEERSFLYIEGMCILIVTLHQTTYYSLQGRTSSTFLWVQSLLGALPFRRLKISITRNLRLWFALPDFGPKSSQRF